MEAFTNLSPVVISIVGVTMAVLFFSPAVIPFLDKLLLTILHYVFLYLYARCVRTMYVLMYMCFTGCCSHHGLVQDGHDQPPAHTDQVTLPLQSAGLCQGHPGSATEHTCHHTQPRRNETHLDTRGRIRVALTISYIYVRIYIL